MLGGVAVVIAGSGTGRRSLGAAERAAHVLCVTAVLAVVQAGCCTRVIGTDPRAQIVLNHAAAEASGNGFAAAFHIMMHEMEQ